MRRTGACHAPLLQEMVTTGTFAPTLLGNDALRAAGYSFRARWL